MLYIYDCQTPQRLPLIITVICAVLPYLMYPTGCPATIFVIRPDFDVRAHTTLH